MQHRNDSSGVLQVHKALQLRAGDSVHLTGHAASGDLQISLPSGGSSSDDDEDNDDAAAGSAAMEQDAGAAAGGASAEGCAARRSKPAAAPRQLLR